MLEPQLRQSHCACTSLPAGPFASATGCALNLTCHTLSHPHYLNLACYSFALSPVIPQSHALPPLPVLFFSHKFIWLFKIPSPKWCGLILHELAQHHLHILAQAKPKLCPLAAQVQELVARIEMLSSTISNSLKVLPQVSSALDNLLEQASGGSQGDRVQGTCGGICQLT